MPSRLVPISLDKLRVSRHHIPAFNRLPNSAGTKRPLLIYHSVFNDKHNFSASTVEDYLRSVGVVEPQWRYTMYSTSHFHSTTHEVLVITAGRALLCLGGEENPDHVNVLAATGDVVVIPAGVAHRLLEDVGKMAGDMPFEMVSSYPLGHSWDMCYGKIGEEEKLDIIKHLEWFERDPIFGANGPVLDK